VPTLSFSSRRLLCFPSKLSEPCLPVILKSLPHPSLLPYPQLNLTLVAFRLERRKEKWKKNKPPS